MVTAVCHLYRNRWVIELLSLNLPALFVLSFSTPAQSYFTFPYNIEGSSNFQITFYVWTLKTVSATNIAGFHYMKWVVKWFRHQILKWYGMGMGCFVGTGKIWWGCGGEQWHRYNSVAAKFDQSVNRILIVTAIRSRNASMSDHALSIFGLGMNLFYLFILRLLIWRG